MSVLRPGQPLDSRFTLLRPLGSGGSSEVWLVRDDELDEEVVAKIVPSTSEEQLELLRREYRHARRLLHPNIVCVFDFHRGTEVAFITMDHVSGRPLSHWRGAPVDQILRLAVPIADALNYAHGLGMVHRDVKASNVVCDEADVPHLLDFGISGWLDNADEASKIVGGGSRSGSSPQQRAGDEPSPSDDIYSLGAMLYDLITDAMPAPVRDLIEKMLAASPKDRPASMAEVKARLEALLQPAARETGSAKPVTPIRLTPPPRIEGSEERLLPRPRFGRWAAGLGLAGVLALIVLVLLPALADRWVSPSPAHANAPDTAPSAGTLTSAAENDDPVDPVLSVADNRRAMDDALGRALELQGELEERAVQRWGGDAYRDVLWLLNQGDEELTRREFSAAERSYRTASERLEAIESRIPSVLAGALEAGRAALLAGDSDGAHQAFSLASAIDPANAEAAAGLHRAEVADDVVALLDGARELEEGGDLAGAEQAYRQAAAMDSEFTPAREGLSRARAGLDTDAFEQAMSLGLAGIDDGDYPAARAALDRANSLRPGSSEVSDARIRLDNAERAVALTEHRQAARTLEAGERWSEATKQYDQALALDATVRFAREGLERSSQRADLAQRIDYHLNHPDRLSSDEVLEEVENLLDEAHEIVPAGPRHQDQVTRLDRLVEAFAHHVTVVLESDDLTEVTVYKVARLGTFLEHELHLRPGTYTVVGSRRGYRDVRHQLVVTAGGERPTLTIRCEEAI